MIGLVNTMITRLCSSFQLMGSSIHPSKIFFDYLYGVFLAFWFIFTDMLRYFVYGLGRSLLNVGFSGWSVMMQFFFQATRTSKILSCHIA